MPGRNHQCDPALLRRYLSGDLAINDETEIVTHLDGCASCQQEIESLAASAADWDDVRRLLTPDSELPRPTSLSMIASPQLRTGETSDSDLPASSLATEARLDFLAPTDDPEMLGRLGPYEIKGLIGHGGMGLVLKAYDRALQRTVAIKVLSPHLATNATARRRFAREAQAAAAVAHEHVIAIHAVAEAGGLPYLVMPYMPGQSLQQRLDEAGPLAPVEVLRIASQIASGLAAAHAQGLVHRDIKPANILLEQGIERVAITDFGLARAIDDASLTRTGVLAGTPAYMSPEQARGETVAHRADLFSLGSLMYAMCAGRPPFRAESTVAVLKRICEEEPTSLAQLNADIPSWLARIIARLHAKEPADRFATAAEVANLLQRCLAHLQNPSAVPLPAEIAEPRPRWKVGWLTGPRLVATSGAIAACVIAVVFWAESGERSLQSDSVRRPSKAVAGLPIAAEDQPKAQSSGHSERAGITNAEYRWLEDEFKQGRIADPETLYQWSLRLLESEHKSAEPNQKTAAIERHLRRMQRLEQLFANQDSPWHSAAQFYVAEAQLMLANDVADGVDEW